MHEPLKAGDPCPRCKAPIETGFLQCETFASGPKWVRRKTMLGLGGSVVARTALTGLAYLEGWRCGKCRMMTLQY
jgi:hypothetical protein